jgi:hypothetical protein
MSPDLRRTLDLLARLQATEERLGAELDATGLTDLDDRRGWLRAHRDPLTVLGMELQAARRQGFVMREHRDSLAMPKVKRAHKRHEFTATELAIADRWFQGLEQRETA